MKIDAWTHILSPAYIRHMEAAGEHGPEASSFLLANRGLRDLNFRFEVMDRYGDYRQVLTPIPGPHVYHGLAGQALVDLVRRNNEEMAEIVGATPTASPASPPRLRLPTRTRRQRRRPELYASSVP